MRIAKILDTSVFQHMRPDELDDHSYTTERVMKEFSAWVKRQSFARVSHGRAPGLLDLLLVAEAEAYHLHAPFEQLEKQTPNDVLGIPDSFLAKLVLVYAQQRGLSIDYKGLKREDKRDMRQVFYHFKKRYREIFQEAGVKTTAQMSSIHFGEGDRLTVTMHSSDPAEIFLQVLTQYSWEAVQKRIGFAIRHGADIEDKDIREYNQFHRSLRTGMHFVSHPEQVLVHRTPDCFNLLQRCFVKTVTLSALQEYPEMIDDTESLWKVVKSRYKRQLKYVGVKRTEEQVQIFYERQLHHLNTLIDSLPVRLQAELNKGYSKDQALERLCKKGTSSARTDLNLVFSAYEIDHTSVRVYTRDRDVKNAIDFAYMYRRSLKSSKSTGRIKLSESAMQKLTESREDTEEYLLDQDRRTQLHAYFCRRRRHKTVKHYDPKVTGRHKRPYPPQKV